MRLKNNYSSPVIIETKLNIRKNRLTKVLERRSWSIIAKSVEIFLAFQESGSNHRKEYTLCRNRGEHKHLTKTRKHFKTIGDNCIQNILRKVQKQIIQQKSL